MNREIEIALPSHDAHLPKDRQTINPQLSVPERTHIAIGWDGKQTWFLRRTMRRTPQDGRR